MNMFRHFLKIFSFLILALVFSILGSIVLDKAKAWVEAPAAPPGYGAADPNDFKPVSKGGTDEYKTGRLGVKTDGFDPTFGLTVGKSGQSDDGIKVSGTSYLEDGDFVIEAGRSLCFQTGADCQSSWAGSSYWTKTGNDIYYNTGNVGIGTPGGLSAKLRVAGGGIKVDGASEFYDTVALFGPAPYLYAGSSSGAGQYGYLWWDDAIKLIRMGHQSVGGAGIAVDNAGNVGIGTTSLSKKLTVAGEIQLNGYPTGLYLGNGQSFFDDGGGGLNIASGATLTLSSGGNIILTGDNVGIGEVSPTAKLHLVGVDTTNSNFALKAVNSSASPLLFVRNDGYVGIGTAGPGYKLHIVGGDVKIGQFVGDNRKLYFGDGSGVWLGEDADEGLQIYTNYRTAIMGGPVGIGTLGPNYTLDVAGDVNITGTYRVNGVALSTNDTNANTLCSGTNVYLDGDGNCDTVVDTNTTYSAGSNLTLLGTQFNVVSSPIFTGNIYAIGFYDYNNSSYYVNPADTSKIDKLIVNRTTNTIAAVDTSGDWTWTNVVSNTYSAGPGNHASNWTNVLLDATRPVLGIKIYGSSDDGGACLVNINSYFTGAVTNNAYISDLDIGGAWNGSAWNSGSGTMATGTFIFDQMISGRNLDVQNYSDNRAYNKPAGLNYIPPNKLLGYSQWYNDGGGNADNTCYVDVLYGSS